MSGAQIFSAENKLTKARVPIILKKMNLLI